MIKPKGINEKVVKRVNIKKQNICVKYCISNRICFYKYPVG